MNRRTLLSQIGDLRQEVEFQRSRAEAAEQQLAQIESSLVELAVDIDADIEEMHSEGDYVDAMYPEELRNEMRRLRVWREPTKESIAR